MRNVCYQPKGMCYTRYMKWISILLLCLFLTPLSVNALTFNPHHIISDTELEDVSTMTTQDIQTFLLSRGSYLSQYTEKVDGITTPASQIISDVAHTYSLNPQFLLTMLQKEQSLVSASHPSQDQLDWAMGFGVCDSCSKSDSRLLGVKGFASQVNSAAEQVRSNYLRDLASKGYTLSGWGPGISKFTVDGIQVTPANRATAVLYTYNPYQGNTEVRGVSVGANFNFWKLWQTFFARLYPDGTIVQDESGGSLYILQDGKRRLFTSMSVFLSSYSPSQIVAVSKADLEKYPLGTPIKFAQYSLLRVPKGTVYLLVGDMLRGIVSREVFRVLGFNPDEVISVSDADVQGYTKGELITLKTAYPQGALVQSNKTSPVYYVKNGVKQRAIDPSLVSANFPYKKVSRISAKELARFEDGGPLLLNEGVLVKGSKSEVYIVSHGALRPIASGNAFEALGYHWENVRTVRDSVLALHLRGENVDIVPEQYTITTTSISALVP